MTTLIFDTETTGLVSAKYDQLHPKQPMPMQIGLKLDDDERVERMAISLLIRPQNWSIESKASEITGITDELATKYGTEFITAIELFLDSVSAADVIVAHNIVFDMTIMRRAYFVYCGMVGQHYSDPFAGKLVLCTMLASQDIVKAPPYRNGKWKWPKLSECIWYFWQENIEGAHDAFTDVRYAAKLYYHLLDTGVFK